MISNLLLMLASQLAPTSLRHEWHAEWRAELHYVRMYHPARAIRFVMGAFRDAWALRQGTQERLLVAASGMRLLALLFLSAVFGVWLACQVSRPSLGPNLLVLPIALAVAPSVTRLDFGFLPQARRLRGWAFLSAKLGASICMAHCAGLVVATTPLAPFAGHFMIVADVLLIRWALDDQRSRCPHCYDQLGQPVDLHSPAGSFLYWNGTESICPNGHGAVFQPKDFARAYHECRWIRFDASWRGL